MAKRVSRYTILTYMQLLSAIYNKAVEWRIAPDTKPFGDAPTNPNNYYSTDRKQTFVKYLPQIRSLDLSHDKNVEFARDLLLIAHETGLGVRQLGTLTNSEGPEDEYKYLNRDGASETKLTATPELKAFVKRYSDVSPCGFLLPIFVKRDTKVANSIDLHSRENGARKQLRPLLATLATLLDYPEPLTIASAIPNRLSI